MSIKLFKRVLLLIFLFFLVSFPTFELPYTISTIVPWGDGEAHGSLNTHLPTEMHPGAGVFNDLVGESLIYQLGFLWFKRIAEAEFHFGTSDQPGRYYAVLDVKAKGFVGWITQQRKHQYRSEFEVVDGGKRLRSVYHKRIISYWEREETFESWMDYTSRRHIQRIIKNNLVTETKNGEIPKGETFEDILSAFYNFRRGVFGKMTSGKHYRITTIPSPKGVNYFKARIATNRERADLKNQGERDFDNSYLVIVDIPPEIFDSKTGDGRIWFGNHNMVPIAGLIKDVKGIGDVTGVLKDVFFKYDDNGRDMTESG